MKTTTENSSLCSTILVQIVDTLNWILTLNIFYQFSHLRKI